MTLPYDMLFCAASCSCGEHHYCTHLDDHLGPHQFPCNSSPTPEQPMKPLFARPKKQDLILSAVIIGLGLLYVGIVLLAEHWQGR